MLTAALDAALAAADESNAALVSALNDAQAAAAQIDADVTDLNGIGAPRGAGGDRSGGGAAPPAPSAGFPGLERLVHPCERGALARLLHPDLAAMSAFY